MSDAAYGRVSSEIIPLEDRRLSCESQPSVVDSDSVVSYHDILENEPFNEKERRLEPDIEDGNGQGYIIESRRVSGLRRDENARLMESD